MKFKKELILKTGEEISIHFDVFTGTGLCFLSVTLPVVQILYFSVHTALKYGTCKKFEQREKKTGFKDISKDLIKNLKTNGMLLASL